VWKYPYMFKLIKEMESKYTVMDTGWKALPVGGIVHHGRHLEVRHIESRLIFLNGKGVV